MGPGPPDRLDRYTVLHTDLERSQSKKLATKNLYQVLIASLVFFQARTIIRLDDNPGVSFYILVAAASTIGANFGIDEWTRFLRWIGWSAVLINRRLF